MGRFIEEHGLTQYNPGRRFDRGGACEIEGCVSLRARLRDAAGTREETHRRLGLSLDTSHDVSTRIDSPLYVDHCHEHGWVRGLICAGCNSAMRFVDKHQCLPRYMPALREEFRRHYNQCPDCQPLPYLPTTDEIGICRELLLHAWLGLGLGWPTVERWLRSHPFSGDVADWLRRQALACGVGLNDFVTLIAQLPYGARYADKVPTAIVNIQSQLGALNRAWAGSYVISLDLVEQRSWQARRTEPGQPLLTAASALTLSDLLNMLAELDSGGEKVQEVAEGLLEMGYVPSVQAGGQRRAYLGWSDPATTDNAKTKFALYLERVRVCFRRAADRRTVSDLPGADNTGNYVAFHLAEPDGVANALAAARVVKG
jgi:hypothetical protein